ncbi:MAG: hypothetical protein E4G74_01210, partial [Erysipelotrichales bacterium]
MHARGYGIVKLMKTMKILGIVADYSLSHKGFDYQLEILRINSRCDLIVALMPG